MTEKDANSPRPKRTLTDDDIATHRAKAPAPSLGQLGGPAGSLTKLVNDPRATEAGGTDPDA